MDEAAAIVARLEPDLGPLEGEPSVLSGGITNRNLRARLGGRDYVLRICAKDAEALSVDRETEVAATRAAHAVGVGPEVVAWLPGDPCCLVTAFVPGQPLSAEQVREPATLTGLAAMLRRIHAGPALTTSFPTFTLAQRYAATARDRGGTVPEAGHRLALDLSERIGGALRGPEHEPVPCHNDLLCANVLRDGERLALLDWEYAGMNDRFFDLGNLAVNNGLDEHDEEFLLEAYFGEPATPRRLAALRLMRLMSDVREAMWGVVQEAISSLDFDYRAYAGEHFTRLRAGAADPRLQEWISAASP